MDPEVDPQPFAYGTFGAPSVCSGLTNISNQSQGGTIGGEYIGWGSHSVSNHHQVQHSNAASNPGLNTSNISISTTNPFKDNNNFNQGQGYPLLSPSFSRKSGRSNPAGYRAKRNSMTSQIEELALLETTFLPISKFIVLYLTFLSCAIFANMAQMIVLFNLLSDDDPKKVALIYFLFPFALFICLKVNDVNLCNQIQRLFDFGYIATPNQLNRNRQFMHWITFIGFPCLWVLYSVLHSEWIQNIKIHSKLPERFGHLVRPDLIDAALISIWTVIQFIQFILCIISLLYCIQHNVHQQRPKELQPLKRATMNPRRFSMSITNPFRPSGSKQLGGSALNQAYAQKVALLERQLSSLQNELIKCKQDVVATNSQLSNDYADELQEKNQEYRALMAERDLLKTECENKKSLLNIKKQQCKQQQASIKSLQQIREENISIINDLKKKLGSSRKELQNVKVLLQIERQNVQKAQEYFDNYS